MQEKNAEKAGFTKSVKKNRSVLLGGLILALIITGGAYVLKKGDSSALYNSGEENYAGQNIRMTEVMLTVAEGQIAIPLAAVKENKIIYTQYSRDNKTVPLTAFIAPSGNVVTAVSICEPCRGTRFHIEGEELVCNACGTKWTLDGLEGTWGGCLKYPPEQLVYKVDEAKAQIILNEQDVAGWQPRKL
ncbi:MAG: DUF2318 domain-containing protein [Peptococcaceae bacterium]